jgi:cytosine/adenosine deaminase-related metal-dependent hydrolase
MDALHSLMAPEVDPYTRVVFGADRTNVETVYVGGRPIYDRGRFPGHDVARVMARGGEELGALLRRHEMG